MRSVAGQIERAIDLPFNELYRPSRAGLGFTLDGSDEARRSAWALVGEWLVAASVDAECATDGLPAVHEWFWAGSGRALGFVPHVAVPLDLAKAADLRALLPYLLDPMAAATRRDVLNTQSTAQERRLRKASGVYYTPGDVAYMMVQKVLSAGEASGGRWWFDPSHGSGVFLRAVLSATHAERSARDRIYGVDLDPLAAETSSFVLTAEDLVLSPNGPAPWERWHRFRRNLATGDALLVDTTSGPRQSTLSFETDDGPIDGHPLGKFDAWRLESVFTETASSGFTHIVANPPYAPLHCNAAGYHISRLHAVTGTTARQDISPVFVELCVSLLRDAGALAVVLPLSVISSTRAPFPALRQHLAEQSGSLEFLAFDRVPDALFGDDIKTRNSIVYLDKSAPQNLSASPLFRWTSRTRETALTEIPVTSITDLDGVPHAIPKIGRTWERELLVACGSRPQYLEHWQTSRRAMPLTGLTTLHDEQRSDVLGLAPTAYNFLGVLRDPYRAVIDGHNSQNSISILQFNSDVHASAAYAVLSSRLAFWIWHVTGDGFHVTASVHRLIPVPAEPCRIERLADLGDRLWKGALQRPSISVNRGRTTVAYPTWSQADLIDEIDDEIGTFIGAPYAKLLSEWHEQLVVVDLDSDRRKLIRRM